MNKSKRKAFGPKKKKLYDLHHHKKKKKELSFETLASESGMKHLRVDRRPI